MTDAERLNLMAAAAERGLAQLRIKEMDANRPRSILEERNHSERQRIRDGVRRDLLTRMRLVSLTIAKADYIAPQHRERLLMELAAEDLIPAEDVVG